jgi:hypothetical protein
MTTIVKRQAGRYVARGRARRDRPIHQRRIRLQHGEPVGELLPVAGAIRADANAGRPEGWFGELVVRVNPVGAALHYIGAVLVNGHDWTGDLS